MGFAATHSILDKDGSRVARSQTDLTQVLPPHALEKRCFVSLNLLNWNVDWTKSEWKAAETKCRIDRQAADIICLTETNTNRLTLPEHGHSICAGDDWGQQRRKGQEGWRKLEVVCNTSLPPGRFVSGVTQTSAGEITVIGVCIPYFHSRVDARWNRKMWQDHEEYLAGLAELLQQAPRSRLIVVGDSTSGSGAAERRCACVKLYSLPSGPTAS